jgi:hypothetical protein
MLMVFPILAIVKVANRSNARLIVCFAIAPTRLNPLVAIALAPLRANLAVISSLLHYDPKTL